LIGATSRHCGAKNPKISPWVKTIPTELPAADPAGNKYFKYVFEIHVMYFVFCI